MTSSILDLVLLAALAGTSGAVLLMYRRLKRFDALQSSAAVAFTDAAAALDRAREAMRNLHDEGGDVAVTLAARLNEARMVMNDIDDRSIQALRIELVSPAAPDPFAASCPAGQDEVPAAPPAAGTGEVTAVAGEIAGTSPARAEPRTATVTPLRPRAAPAEALSPAAAPALSAALLTQDAAAVHMPLAATATRPEAGAPAPLTVPPTPCERASAAMRAVATRAAPMRPHRAASSALAAAVPQPAPGPMPPRAGSPTPLRTPAPLPPRGGEPKPTLHRARAPAPNARFASLPGATRAAAEISEPTFGSRGITLADLARAARGADLAHA